MSSGSGLLERRRCCNKVLDAAMSGRCESGGPGDSVVPVLPRGPDLESGCDFGFADRSRSKAWYSCRLIGLLGGNSGMLEAMAGVYCSSAAASCSASVRPV